ncbi:hypothetical protein E0494_08205 [Marinilabiliaceae bacterium JC040]|nr:hypothetical protein [Marinilabiliaceae bacterium JC040]
MKKIFTILFLATLLFASCSEDEVSSVKKVGDKVFNLPELTSSVGVIKVDLENSFTSVVQEGNGNSVVLKAKSPKNNKVVFTELVIVLSTNEAKEVQSCNVCYKLVDGLTSSNKASILKIFKERTKFKHTK